MGVEQLRSLLRKHRTIALDTNLFIYQLEANARYVALADAVFSWMEKAGHEAVTSTITMTELLVPSYREAEEEKADEVYTLLSTYPNLRWIAPDLELADEAARIRALYRLRTPDALQAATAIRTPATALFTNNPAFSRVPGFEAVLLDRFLK